MAHKKPVRNPMKIKSLKSLLLLLLICLVHTIFAFYYIDYDLHYNNINHDNILSEKDRIFVHLTV